MRFTSIVVALLALFCIAVPKRASAAEFTRGDANADGNVDISDGVFILGYLFEENAAVPPCNDAADVDDSGSVDISDAIRLLSHLFQGQEGPANPYPESGFDRTPDDPFTCGDPPPVQSDKPSSGNPRLMGSPFDYPPELDTIVIDNFVDLETLVLFDTEWPTAEAMSYRNRLLDWAAQEPSIDMGFVLSNPSAAPDSPVTLFNGDAISAIYSCRAGGDGCCLGQTVDIDLFLFDELVPSSGSGTGPSGSETPQPTGSETPTPDTSPVPETDGSEIEESAGICATIATAHSLVYDLEVIDEDWPGVTDGDNWDRDFLDKIWKESQGKKGKGTTIPGAKDGHEADWNTDWNVVCSENTEFKDDAKKACEELAKTGNEDDGDDSNGEEEGDDCNISLRGPKGGHALNVVSATWNESTEECEITTVNTGVQGKPRGNGVPTNPGTQDWTIGEDAGGGLDITNTDGPHKTFWNGRGYNQAIFYCCDEEPAVDGVTDQSHPGTMFN